MRAHVERVDFLGWNKSLASKIIVVNEDEMFAGMFKKNYQEILIIPVHAFA